MPCKKLTAKLRRKKGTQYWVVACPYCGLNHWIWAGPYTANAKAFLGVTTLRCGSQVEIVAEEK